MYLTQPTFTLTDEKFRDGANVSHLPPLCLHRCLSNKKIVCNLRFGSGIPNDAILIDDTCLHCQLPLSAHCNGRIILSGRLNVGQRNEKTAGQEVTMWFHRLRQCDGVAGHFEVIRSCGHQLWRQCQLNRIDWSIQTWRFAVMLNDTFNFDNQTAAWLNDNRIAGDSWLWTQWQFDGRILQRLKEETRQTDGCLQCNVNLIENDVHVFAGDRLLVALFIG